MNLALCILQVIVLLFIGKITPISSFTTNATTPVNNYLIYSIPLEVYYPPPTQNYYYIALGVVGI
jgi:hypothetical protein